MKDWREFQKARLNGTIPTAEGSSLFTNAKLWALTTLLPVPAHGDIIKGADNWAAKDQGRPMRPRPYRGHWSGFCRGQVSTTP